MLAAAFAVAACTHIDTGQVDYRVADAPATVSATDMRPIGAGCAADQTTPCDPILPSRVVRRYMPDREAGWSAFRRDQVYSIEIEQGMIGRNILEGAFLGRQYGNRAEIAILANVFEFASEQGDAAARRFLDAGEFEGKADDRSDVELKLVYFSDDVARGQALNFSNIPLRARSAYGGGSIGIQIVVMEVDAQTGPVASLLKTLARLGERVVPARDEAKDILFDLGESLLSGGHDDRLLEYRFVLSAGADDARAVQATFAPGRYVVRRMQDRNGSMEWGSLRLDHNTGRLYRTPATGSGAFVEVRDDLYLTINVRRYPDGTRPEFYAQRDWSAFRAALQVAADAKAEPLDRVTERLTSVLEDGRSRDLRDAVLLKWADAANRLDLYAARYAPSDFAGVDVAGCPATIVDLKRRRDGAEREARDALRAFVASYQQALAAKRKDAKGAVTGDEFRADERDRVVAATAGWFMPWSDTGASAASFSDHDAFEKAFVAASPTSDLATVALAAAVTKAASGPTCLALLSR